MGTTGRPPISYSGCLDICVYILYGWLSFQGAKYTHIWGYEWVGGNGDGGDGLHAESDWGVWRAPLEVVGADIHSPAPIPKEGLCRHSHCQGGWNKE